MLRSPRGRRKGGSEGHLWKDLDAKGWVPSFWRSKPEYQCSDPTSPWGRNLRDMLDQLPWLVCAFLSYQRQQAVSRQAQWLPWEETEPQKEQGSHCIIPSSTGDNDKSSSQPLCSNTHPGVGGCLQEEQTCRYRGCRSRADSARQRDLFQKQVLSSA